ncbi:MAG TPA: sensor domain-containing diguanylate cyclase [bacterium]|nr:sensor domain-containing diguanylate cyclase [bacterium]
MVIGVLLLVTAVKFTRLALRGEDYPRTRRDDIEAGGLLVVAAGIVVQATGGPLSPVIPATFVLVALLAAQTDLAGALVLGALSAALEAAPVFAHGNLATSTAGGWHSTAATVGAHAALSLFAATAVGLFLRIERTARLDAQRRLARFRGDTDDLADETDDVDDLKSTGTPIAAAREKRLRDLKNAMDKSIEGAIRTARASLAAHSVLYLRLSRDGARLAIADAATDSDDLAETGLDPRTGFFAGAIKSKGPVALADVRGAPVPYYTKDVGVRSVVAAPVLQNGWVTGLLVADHLEPDRYGKTAGDVLAGIAGLVSELEHGGKERERHQKLQDQLTQLVEISKSLQESLSPEELARRALTASRNLAEFDFAVVATAAGDSEERFTITTAMGVDQGRLLGKDAPTGDTLVGWALRNRMYLNVPSFRDRTVKTPLFGRRIDPDGVRAALVFPMLRADGTRDAAAKARSGATTMSSRREIDNAGDLGRSVGAMVIGSMTRDAFTHDEFEMLELIANQTALVMSNAVLYRRMEELATTDGLTGLNNHRYFQETATREVERAQRNPATRFALVLMDIDHFKKVNDGYGHPMGDEVLRRVSKILKATIQRKTDLVARYGGEEFVLVLADTNAEGARSVVDRIRAAVAKEEFEFEGKTFRVTMSAGVVGYPDDIGHRPQEPAAQVKQALIDRADKALYHSKETGRNRSTLWSEIASTIESAAPAPAPPNAPPRH